METQDSEKEISDLKAKIRELLLKPENANILKDAKSKKADPIKTEIETWAATGNTRPADPAKVETEKQVKSQIAAWAIDTKNNNR